MNTCKKSRVKLLAFLELGSGTSYKGHSCPTVWKLYFFNKMPLYFTGTKFQRVTFWWFVPEMSTVYENSMVFTLLDKSVLCMKYLGPIPKKPTILHEISYKCSSTDYFGAQKIIPDVSKWMSSKKPFRPIPSPPFEKGLNLVQNSIVLVMIQTG